MEQQCIKHIKDHLDTKLSAVCSLLKRFHRCPWPLRSRAWRSFSRMPVPPGWLQPRPAQVVTGRPAEKLIAIMFNILRLQLNWLQLSMFQDVSPNYHQFRIQFAPRWFPHLYFPTSFPIILGFSMVFLWENHGKTGWFGSQAWKDPSLRSIPESHAPRRPLALAQGGVAPPPARPPPREPSMRSEAREGAGIHG